MSSQALSWRLTQYLGFIQLYRELKKVCTATENILGLAGKVLLLREHELCLRDCLCGHENTHRLRIFELRTQMLTFTQRECPEGVQSLQLIFEALAAEANDATW